MSRKPKKTTKRLRIHLRTVGVLTYEGCTEAEAIAKVEEFPFGCCSVGSDGTVSWDLDGRRKWRAVVEDASDE